MANSHAVSFNCSEPPNLGFFDIQSCCRMPEIDLGEAPSKCSAYINMLKAQTINMNGVGKNNNSNKENGNNRTMDEPTQQSIKQVDYPALAHICYPDCIYRETISMMENEFNMENVKKFLNKNVSKRDIDVVPQIVQSFETCLYNIKGHMKTAGIEMFAKLPIGCSPFASMMYGCVNAESFLHCPVKMWKNDYNCNMAKSFAQQCNPLPHVPLPME
ncbi:uncharacterized protein [Eurosta solidaginis]|uniref:uncharacterized protein isoform X2 n=1 Tax=Eurosta solidaginis TaxID=178769 RepID=UPI0035313E65